MVNISATAVFYRMILFLLHNRDEERTASIAVQARSFMEKELSYSTSIDVICAAVHVSRSILYEEFRKKYGCSPIKYNNKLVIIYAMDLLTNGRMSLQETSDRLGFSSKKQFSKVFQSVTGFTPTNYVRMHKIEYGKSFQIDSGSFYNKEEVQ